MRRRANYFKSGHRYITDIMIPNRNPRLLLPHNPDGLVESHCPQVMWIRRGKRKECQNDIRPIQITYILVCWHCICTALRFALSPAKQDDVPHAQGTHPERFPHFRVSVLYPGRAFSLLTIFYSCGTALFSDGELVFSFAGGYFQ